MRILGKGQKPLPTGGLTGSTVFRFRCYYDYGLSVSFVSDGSGVLRVDWVAFRPLFD
jgi:hypothetical protein